MRRAGPPLIVLGALACGAEGREQLAPPPEVFPPPFDGPEVRWVESPEPEAPVVGRPVSIGPWRLSARALRYPTVRPDCGLRVRSLGIENGSEGPRRIRVHSIDAPFALHPATPPELEVQGLGEVQLEVMLPPVVSGRYRGRLVLELQDGGWAEVALNAQVLEEHTVEDVVRRPGGQVRDLLFVLDDSLGMVGFQAAFEASLRSFLGWAQASAPNLRVGLISGRPVEEDGSRPILAPDEPPLIYVEPENAERLLKIWAERFSPRSGRSDALLAAALSGLRQENFLRPDSTIDVVVVTAGDDASKGAVDVWVDAFRELRGFRRPELMSLSVIAGGDGRCSGPGGEARPSPRLLKAMAATGGFFYSLCSHDWAPALEDLGHPSPGFEVRLSEVPRVDALEVSVGGVGMATRDRAGARVWSYDGSVNRVLFTSAAPPEPGVEVEIRYPTSCR
ncbi:MAG: hypothetical protein AAFZ18_34805 [Myxococcota bacterium]